MASIISPSLGHNAPPNDGRVFFYPLEHGQCEYVQFDEILAKLKARYKYFRTDLSDKVGGNVPLTASYGKLKDDRVVDYKKAFFLKDQAYRHEEEYRFILRGATRNDRSYQECCKDQFFSLFDTHLRPVRHEDTGENIFIPFSHTLIEEVWLDARSAAWKQSKMAHMLQEHGILAKVSPAYGAFFERHRIRPMI